MDEFLILKNCTAIHACTHCCVKNWGWDPVRVQIIAWVFFFYIYNVSHLTFEAKKYSGWFCQGHFTLQRLPVSVCLFLSVCGFGNILSHSRQVAMLCIWRQQRAFVVGHVCVYCSTYWWASIASIFSSSVKTSTHSLKLPTGFDWKFLVGAGDSDCVLEALPTVKEARITTLVSPFDLDVCCRCLVHRTGCDKTSCSYICCRKCLHCKDSAKCPRRHESASIKETYFPSLAWHTGSDSGVTLDSWLAYSGYLQK